MGTVTMPSPSHHNHQSSSLCAPFLSSSNFPDTFQDFFAKLSEVGDDNDENIMNILEDKQLLPPKVASSEPGFRRKLPERHWSMNRKSLRRRNNEMQTKGSARTEGRMPQQISLPPHSSSSNILVSPMAGRRRSSSIAVARAPPDLHRFLQAEQQRPWLQVGPRAPSPEPNPGIPSSKSVSPRPPRHSPVPPEGNSYNRNRTASMPVVPSRHRPMLAQTKRNDDGMEYYRLRSFSITPNGIFNLGDSFKSRRSRSISSVNSTESSQTDLSVCNRDRLPSTTSQSSTGAAEETPTSVPTYRVAMLGSSGVGKTALTYQFTTSEYICAYDTSLDDEFGQKTVSVMLDGRETELEIIDHPSSEMSVETFCSTYNPDVYVVVYSVVDRKSMKVAEEILLYLWKSDYMASRGVILVGNKADLERKREVPMSVGRKLANSCGCKFIETSSGLDHNVDELLVGILAQDSDAAVGPAVDKSVPPSHTVKPVSTTKEDPEEKLLEKKPTVLESHGYTLGRTIGTGSYATVKVARSERHSCLVAVKIVSKFQAPPDYLKKFLPREIEVVKGLKHVNLIRFLQAIETTHRVYIIMEYAENGSLLDVIRKDQYIDEIRARKYFRQLVDAVDYCHERGVVHRDIKCENLLMDHDYNVKLSDFGFARGHMRIKNGVAPLSETFCGSYAYASPEILRGIPYQPQLSDIWSMGVVLYAIVYGRLPFDDTNYNQLLKQVQSKITFPKEPKVSSSCKSLVTKILAPVRVRLRIPSIRTDSWFAQGPSDSSTRHDSEETIQSTQSDKSTSDATPVQLVTKEVLKANASKPDKSRNSAEEEYPLETTEPRSRSTSRVNE